MSKARRLTLVRPCVNVIPTLPSGLRRGRYGNVAGVPSHDSLVHTLAAPGLTFEQLSVFVLAASTGSFTETADRLFLSQPAISQRIRHLELLVGVPLFLREGRRGLRLTPAGEQFLEFAREALASLELVLEKIASDRAEPEHPVLSIASTSGIIRYVLPELVARFSRLYPQYSVQLSLLTPSEITEAVANGSFDLGVRAEPIDESVFAKYLLIEDQLVVVGRPDIAVRDLQEGARAKTSYPFLLTSRDSGIRKLFERWARQAGVRVNVVMEGNDVDALRRAAVMGLGLTVLPMFTVRDSVESGSLRVIEGMKLPATWPVYLVYRRDRPLPTSARAFLSFLSKRRARQQA